MNEENGAKASELSEQPNNQNNDREEVYSKVVRAGNRTYFFDVRGTKAGDYYLTITESKKHEDDEGHSFYKKHKIYLYKEDFENFTSFLHEVTNYIVREKGSEVISETHNPDFKKISENGAPAEVSPVGESEGEKDFTNLDFDDI